MIKEVIQINTKGTDLIILTIDMPKNISKKNEEKLKVFLSTQVKKNDTKSGNTAVRNSGSKS